jgi:hypothetical protein
LLSNALHAAPLNGGRPWPYTSLVEMTAQLHHQLDLRPLRLVLKKPLSSSEPNY